VQSNKYQKRLLKAEGLQMTDISKASELIREEQVVMCCQEAKKLAKYFEDARTKCKTDEQELTEATERVLQSYYHTEDM
jgi:hypothetical protein